MSHNEDEQKIDRDLEKTSTWLLAAFGFGWLAILARFAALAVGGYHFGTATSWVGQMFSSFVWSLAWFAATFVFGFLFGVPKVVTPAAGPAGPPGATPVNTNRLKVNTNLEDISDWLTKVIVGATLTQILKIPAAISRAAHFMATGDTAFSAVGFNAANLVYYSALGFLAGYILTRMFFARAFALADQDPNDSGNHNTNLPEQKIGETMPNTPPVRK